MHEALVGLVFKYGLKLLLGETIQEYNVVNNVASSFIQSYLLSMTVK